MADVMVLKVFSPVDFNSPKVRKMVYKVPKTVHQVPIFVFKLPILVFKLPIFVSMANYGVPKMGDPHNILGYRGRAGKDTRESMIVGRLRGFLNIDRNEANDQQF